MNNIEAFAAAIGLQVTKGGGVVSIAGIVFSSWFVGLLGVCIAAVGLWVNWHFQRKRDKREEDEHQARMLAMLKPGLTD